MDLDRTSLGDRTPELRSRSQQSAERPEQPREAPAPVRPEHGGALASSQVEREARQQPDPDTEARRRRALDVVARFLKMPGGTELDIEVDPDSQQVRFLIRDRRTGEVVREVPEAGSQSLVESLRESLGSLVDRSL